MSEKEVFYPIIASAEAPRDSEATPYIAYDEAEKRARYYIDIKDKSFELTAEEYRDVVATIGLGLRQELTVLLDKIDMGDLASWLNTVASRPV